MSSEFSDVEASNADEAASSAGSESIAENGSVEVDEPALSTLHPTSLIFDVISHGKNYLIPALIAMFSAARGDTWGILIAGLLFVPAISLSCFRYFTLRYSIQNGQLVVTKGLIFRSVRTVPVSRIQNVDFVQNMLHRLFSVAEVRVETASGTRPEAILRVLSLEQMQRLRREIFDLQSDRSSMHDVPIAQFATPTLGESETQLSGQRIAGQLIDPLTDNLRSSGVPLLEIPASWLVRAGLASNRGLVMVGIALGVFLQFDGEKRFEFLFQEIEKRVPQNADAITVAVGVALAIIGLLLTLRLLGIGWYLLRFYGYRLERHGEDLRISCGLLTKVSATVPRNRIQFISIHRNLILRWMGFSSIRIETAGGGSGTDNENASTTVSRRWFVPIVANSKLPGLMEQLRPGLVWDESTIKFQALAPRAGWRMVRLAILLACLLAGLGVAVWRPWGWVVGVGMLPVFVWYAIRKSQSMKYARTNDGVVYRSGILVRKTSLTFFEKIQTLRIDQTPFDRRWKMARLSVDTAAAGPADHRMDIPYLEEDFAQAELAALQDRATRHQPRFK